MAEKNKEYEAAHNAYRKLADAAAKGDVKAKEDKLQAFQTVRAMEREAAKGGVVLRDGKIVGTGIPTKKSLQEEYIRKLDGEKQVEIDGKETTVRQHAKERLGH